MQKDQMAKEFTSFSLPIENVFVSNAIEVRS